MDAEKGFYSLLGCLTVSAVVRNSMDLHWAFFVVLTLLFWSGCIITQTVTKKQREKDAMLAASARNELIKSQQEYLVNFTSTAQEKQMENVTILLEKVTKEMSRQLESIYSEIRELQDSAEKQGRDVVLLIKKIESNLDCFNTLSECVQKGFEDVKGTLNRLPESIASGWSKDLNKLSEDMVSNISLIQELMNDMDSKLGDIQNTNADALTKFEDIKDVIEENAQTGKESINDLTDVMKGSMEKQFDIISGEKDVLEQYEKLIGYINDEVVAKLIVDSDNLLKCMRDCYILLESFRKVRK